jgi:hypothetical protein
VSALKKYRDFHITEELEDLDLLPGFPPGRGPPLIMDARRESDGALVTFRVAFEELVQGISGAARR